jgi:hypothetical protein
MHPSELDDDSEKILLTEESDKKKVKRASKTRQASKNHGESIEISDEPSFSQNRKQTKQK